MAQSQTPEAQARRMARFVYTTLRANPQDYLDVSGPVTFDTRVLLHVAGFSPDETLRPQLINRRRRGKAMAQMEHAQQLEAQAEAFKRSQRDAYARGEMYAEVVKRLRRGAEARDVQDYISKHQRWPCFALAATQKELEREMALRYALGRCEVDFGAVALPEGVMVSCRMIPHEWGRKT